MIATTNTNRRNGANRASVAQVSKRVAAYCRVSTDERLDMEFNSLEAQRQAVEAYVASQKAEGWAALPDRYDDGGFSGGDTDRPAFQRLLQDVEAGRVDICACYKLDRLSRSLLDFLKIMEFFEKHEVAFISVTQRFDTSSSTGKLLLNILAAFGEFERRTIAERTMDKMGGMRRRGMWTGGRIPLGYTVVEKKLQVNQEEAERVREIFQTFADVGSPIATVEELNGKGWLTKTKARWDKHALHRVLGNPVYIGKVPYRGEVYDGAHEAIVDQELWDAVQGKLRNRPGENTSKFRSRSDALLAGLLKCAACGASMSPHFSSKGKRRYAYYCCQTLQKQGKSACPGSRVQALELERFVVQKIKSIGEDPKVFRTTLQATRRAVQARKAEIATELKKLDRETSGLGREKKNILVAIGKGGKGVSSLLNRLGEVDEAIQKASIRVDELRSELSSLESQTIDERDLRTALGEFEPVWNELFPAERSRIIRLLIEKISYHAKDGEVELTFRPGGIRTLAKKEGNEPHCQV